MAKLRGMSVEEYRDHHQLPMPSLSVVPRMEALDLALELDDAMDTAQRLAEKLAEHLHMHPELDPEYAYELAQSDPWNRPPAEPWRARSPLAVTDLRSDLPSPHTAPGWRTIDEPCLEPTDE